MRLTLIQAETDRTLPFEQRIAVACEQIAACHGADLVVLPELWATGYFHFDDYAATAQPRSGEAARALAAAARAAGVHLHAGSLVERDEQGRLYNTSLLYGPDGELLHAYRKIHLFGYDSRESALLTAGQGAAVVPTPFGRIGLAACYDLRFPELFRAQTEQGAELLLLSAAWPLARIEHWQLLLRARAIENQAMVVAVNAGGRQGEVELGGHSMVVDASGQVLLQTGSDPEIRSVDLDLTSTAQARRTFPALADRRPPSALEAVPEI
ncbi:carbon-nitrogen family hydrolase [Kitasatospora azatica]|uniref:carbon-nitrogen family hydrolase n=1 Tax=Kitasatospora azatica TaxID=58347 RepID=UPI00056CBBCE|nr:carbon-nitrogen family hydrolase [Kitasatospora azatica]